MKTFIRLFEEDLVNITIFIEAKKKLKDSTTEGINIELILDDTKTEELKEQIYYLSDKVDFS